MKLGDLSSHHVVSVAPQDSLEQDDCGDGGAPHSPPTGALRPARSSAWSPIETSLIASGDLSREGDRSKRPTMGAGACRGRHVYNRCSHCRPMNALRSATWMMIHRRVHAIPLLHRDRLVGIVAESDLLRGVTASPEFAQNAFSAAASRDLHAQQRDDRAG